MQELRDQYPELNARVMRFQRAGTPMTNKQRQRLSAHLEAINLSAVAKGTGERSPRKGENLLSDKPPTRAQQKGGRGSVADHLQGNDAMAAASAMALRSSQDELKVSVNAQRLENEELKEIVKGLETKLDTVLELLTATRVDL